jgi:hypothetical protein
MAKLDEKNNACNQLPKYQTPYENIVKFELKNIPCNKITTYYTTYLILKMYKSNSYG